MQLRDKQLDGAELLELAKRLRSITAGTKTLFIVNDRPDIAVLSGADGLHLGQNDLPPQEARKLVGAQMLVGLSTHNLGQVKASVGEPIDYIGFGPLYATNSKACPDPVIGPELLKQAAALAAHPIVAIGGLDQQRINTLDLKACRCAAVIRAVTEAGDPLSAMQALNQTIQENLS
ncbi:MAG: Thiamine-phosphate synthase [Deltaproteobacteria bacterium ADurb.Bin510]|nr:MAG: Thiamine-phosphate synthase [Deltaproteobacteria bacterium ADurb.Bin510]